MEPKEGAIHWAVWLRPDTAACWLCTDNYLIICRTTQSPTGAARMALPLTHTHTPRPEAGQPGPFPLYTPHPTQRQHSQDPSPIVEDTIGPASTHGAVSGNGTDRQDGERQDEIGNQQHGQGLQQPSVTHHEPWASKGKAGKGLGGAPSLQAKTTPSPFSHPSPKKSPPLPPRAPPHSPILRKTTMLNMDSTVGTTTPRKVDSFRAGAPPGPPAAPAGKAAASSPRSR